MPSNNWKKIQWAISRRRPLGFSYSVGFEQAKITKVYKESVPFVFGPFSTMRKMIQVMRRSPFFISFHSRTRGLRGTSIHSSEYSAGRKILNKGFRLISFGDFT